MYEGLLHLHSVLRWIILILLLVAIFKSLADKDRPFTYTSKKIGLWLMIAADIILLVGIYQWIAGPLGLKNIQQLGMKEVMSNNYFRFFAIEHLMGMILAIALIHIGRSAGKKNVPDKIKHRLTVLFYGLALLIILIMIPWPFRFVGENRTWFPGL